MQRIAKDRTLPRNSPGRENLEKRMIEQSHVPLRLGVHGGASGTWVSNYLVSEQLGPRYFDVALPRRIRPCRLVALSTTRRTHHSCRSYLVPFSRGHQGR